jgi:hypothetical protein
MLVKPAVHAPAMIRVHVEIEVPDTLATQAKKAGLLEPSGLPSTISRGTRHHASSFANSSK